MKKRRILSLLLCLCLILSLLPGTAFAAGDQYEGTRNSEVSGYHYNQLTDLAKIIYDGIDAMNLQTGTDEYDLVGHGLNGDNLPVNTELNNAMNAARYAYYADHPEVFYVNFPKLTLRTTQDQSGNKHIYVGSGRNASYLIDSFSDEAAVESAAAEFNARVAEIVEGAKAVTAANGESLQAAQIRYVHNEIINHVSYRLEDTAATGNAPLLGTPYGVLVKKQGVCEGYSRAFKTVMDQLGINCILVQGVHKYDNEVAINHMWNYVEITDAAEASAARTNGGKWYAVDATLDDPEIPVVTENEQTFEYNKYHNRFDEYGKDNFEQEKYLLAGQLTMNERHFEAEEVNAAGGYHFGYPVLEDNDLTVSIVSNDLDGFFVQTKDVTGSASGDIITEFQFNYLGMTATAAKEKGIYLVWRYYNEDKETGEIVPEYNKHGSWFYLDTEAYQIKEEGGFVCIQEGNTPYVEIAATRTPPSSDTSEMKNLTYLGDDSGLIARTGKLYNPNRTGYVPPPFIKKQTPSQTGTINVSNRFYHVTAEYDETLKTVPGKNVDDIEIKCRSRLGENVTGAEYSEIKNFKWDGDKTVEFDIKFSQMFADDNVIYNIVLEGLVGATSEKTPNPISYTARQKGTCPCIMQRDGNWDVFGKPTLLEGDDLSLNGWKTSNDEPVSDLVKDRLTLITTKTTEEQNKQIAKQIEKDVDEEILSSATYNITLSVCKSMVIKTGHKVKVRLGFPEGYGPNDEGVTFKAYHFQRDNQGNVIGVEEIDCVVTQYGLILTCDSFSPFMIAVVKKDDNVAEDKTVVVTTSDGGTVSGDNLSASGIVKLEDGQSQTVKFTARDGYNIESITVCGKEIEVTDKKSATVQVSYADIQNANNIVNANFVASEVVKKEEDKGQTPVKPTAEPAKIEMSASKSVAEGGTLTIEPTVAEQANGVQTFQWYKDGVKLEGKISKNLEIKNITADDAGKYTLTVTTTVDTVSVDSSSSECEVAVTPKSGSSSSGSGSSAVSVNSSKNGSVSVSPQSAKKGDTVTVTLKPDAGYELNKLAILDKNGNALELTKKSDTRYTFIMPDGKVSVAVDFVEIVTSDESSFVDVAKDAYYYDAVMWAVKQGITNGITADTFRPNSSCTRAQMVTFLWRAVGSPKVTGSNVFTDIKTDDYYYDAVLWAVEQGITKGITATTFAPNTTVNRAQTVTFLYRANSSPASEGSSFADVPAGAYYADAVVWAKNEGITAGLGGNVFSPKSDCTRGQIVTFLHRNAQ